MNQPSQATRVIVTSLIVVIAVLAVGWKFWHFWTNPWTRNGRVMAQVVQVTPRVSGTIVDLPIVDNQFVEKGTQLFQIDPRTFQSSLDGAEGLLAETIDEIEALTAQVAATEKTIEQYDAAIQRAIQKVKGAEARLTDFQAEFKRYTELVKTGAASQERVDRAVADVTDAEAWLEGMRAELQQARAAKLQAEADLLRDIANRGELGDANARLRTARARVHSAHLQLEFTEVMAPVDGYITHLNLRLGDQAVANKPALALVDVNSYWVYGFFKEHYIGNMTVGDRAIVTLMSDPDNPIEGRVTGRGWGIFQSDGSTSQELLPKIGAAYQWVRQPERVPVRIEFDSLPEGTEMIVGTTASVMVMTGTAGEDAPPSMAAAAQKVRAEQPPEQEYVPEDAHHGGGGHGDDGHGGGHGGGHDGDAHGGDAHGTDAHSSDGGHGGSDTH